MHVSIYVMIVIYNVNFINKNDFKNKLWKFTLVYYAFKLLSKKSLIFNKYVLYLLLSRVNFMILILFVYNSFGQNLWACTIVFFSFT